MARAYILGHAPMAPTVDDIPLQREVNVAEHSTRLDRIHGRASNRFLASTCQVIGCVMGPRFRCLY